MTTAFFNADLDQTVHLSRKALKVKFKRNNCLMNLSSTLALFVGILFFGNSIFAADQSKQIDDKAKESALPKSNSHDNSESGVMATDTTLSTNNKAKTSLYYAKVGDMFINWIDYENAYFTESSKKFYHGKPTEGAVAAFQREIGDKLITNAMLVLEAKRRKIKPDDEFVKQQIEQFEKRVAKDPKWPDSRPRVLPIIKERAENESLRVKIEKAVRNVPAPSAKQLRKYYNDHPDKFTAPAQPHVAVILIRVDPGAPDADWQQATEQAQDLVKRLRTGEDFAKLARQYSGDQTAEDGGDMGYLHEGMLPGLPAQTVAKLQPGETSDPVTLMEGVAIFRLIERKLPEIRSFKAVQSRAKDLWLNEQSDLAWNSLIEKLKKNTPVQVDESQFLPLSPVNVKPTEKAVEDSAKSTEATKP